MEESQQNPSTAIDELHNRLQEAEDTVRAIRAGEIDALVVTGPLGEKVFILRGADHPYQVIVEEMNEGAATLSPRGDYSLLQPALCRFARDSAGTDYRQLHPGLVCAGRGFHVSCARKRPGCGRGSADAE